jgi:hypothetical protein
VAVIACGDSSPRARLFSLICEEIYWRNLDRSTVIDVLLSLDIRLVCHRLLTIVDTPVDLAGQVLILVHHLGSVVGLRLA